MALQARPIRHYDQRWRSFGRRLKPFLLGDLTTVESRAALSSDLRLFALTFVGGFLFMTVYLA